MDDNGWHSHVVGMDSDGYVFHKPAFFARESWESKKRWKYIRSSKVSEDMINRLYDHLPDSILSWPITPLERCVGAFVICAGVGLVYSVGSCVYRSAKDPRTHRQRRLERPLGTVQIENSQEQIREDINGNGLPERYIEIDGRKYFLEIDGKPVDGNLQQK